MICLEILQLLHFKPTSYQIIFPHKHLFARNYCISPLLNKTNNFSPCTLRIHCPAQQLFPPNQYSDRILIYHVLSPFIHAIYSLYWRPSVRQVSCCGICLPSAELFDCYKQNTQDVSVFRSNLSCHLHFLAT